jgi:hypothetical protein
MRKGVAQALDNELGSGSRLRRLVARDWNGDRKSYLDLSRALSIVVPISRH